jgi:ribonuclease III
MELGTDTGSELPYSDQEYVPPQDLAKKINYKFHNLRLLTRALTHRSYVNEHPEVPEDNERLEFLGDAVLDFVVGAWLYNRYPEMAEGQLTRMRSALVRTEQLAEFARQLDLGPSMRLGRGELHGGGRRRPALLCATFEALIGALYLQGEIAAVRDFIFPILERSADGLILQPDVYDAKSRLQEWAQANKLGIPRYETRSAEGPDHAKTFVVDVFVNSVISGTGAGPNKQIAAQSAAADALNKVDDYFADERLDD